MSGNVTFTKIRLQLLVNEKMYMKIIGQSILQFLFNKIKYPGQG